MSFDTERFCFGELPTVYAKRTTHIPDNDDDDEIWPTRRWKHFVPNSTTLSGEEKLQHDYLKEFFVGCYCVLSLDNKVFYQAIDSEVAKDLSKWGIDHTPQTYRRVVNERIRRLDDALDNEVAQQQQQQRQQQQEQGGARSGGGSGAAGAGSSSGGGGGGAGSGGAGSSSGGGGGGGSGRGDDHMRLTRLMKHKMALDLDDFPREDLDVEDMGLPITQLIPMSSKKLKELRHDPLYYNFHPCHDMTAQNLQNYNLLKLYAVRRDGKIVMAHPKSTKRQLKKTYIG